MPKTSHYLTREERELLIGLAHKYDISQSKILGMALGKYAEILQEDGEFSEELASVARKATLSAKLKELRNEGKLLARDIAYAEANRRRALKAIDESEMSQEEKKYWKNIIEEHARTRREIAEELLGNPKKGRPPKKGSKKWYIRKIKGAAEEKNKVEKWRDFNDMLVKKYIYQDREIPEELLKELDRLHSEAFEEM